MFSGASVFPGVYFETVKPVLETVLPRMDIAAFVGFASAGPLHTPVAVEDITRFREIFGADLELAWNARTRQTEKGCLGAAVENYFRNGGKRCWVVRVADEDIAQTARFAIPGLFRCDGSTLQQAYARARSPGSWADYVRLRSQINIRSLQLQQPASQNSSLHIGDSDWYADIVATEDSFQPGDLIAIAEQNADLRYYLLVAQVTANNKGVRISGTQGFLLYTGEPGSPAVFDSLLALSSTVPGIQLFKLSDFATLGAELDWPLVASPASADVSMPPSVQLLNFQLRSLERDGAVKTLDALRFYGEHPRFWGVLPDDATLFTLAEGKPTVNIPEQTAALIAQANTPRFPVCGPTDSADAVYLPLQMVLSQGPNARAEYSSVQDSLTRNGLENFGSIHFVDERLTDLGAETLQREANRLVYLTQPPAKLRGVHSLLTIKEATLLAVPDAIHSRWDRHMPDLEMPLAEPELLSIEKSDTYKDNWKIAWSPVANARYYRLQWSVDPDFASSTTVIVGSDDLAQIGSAADLQPQPESEYYFLPQHFCPQAIYFRVRAEREAKISAWSNNMARIIPEVDFTECNAVPAETLELRLQINASIHSPSDSGLAEYDLSWHFLSAFALVADIDQFDLERADEFGFAAADIMFQGPPPSLENAEFPALTIQAEPGVTSYFRVRARSGKTLGPWSNTVTLWPSQLDRTTLIESSELSQDLLAIQRCAIRTCAARGDLFGILSFPHRYEVQDVLDHCAALKPGGDVLSAGGGDVFSARVPVLTSAETRLTSHAALYFPWLASRTDTRLDIRLVPPEGAVLGKMASRALEQGAWIAPANAPFENVIGLGKPISREQWSLLMQSQVNVVRRDPRGHLLLSADTFSRDIEYNEINVRRLMSLIRRIAEDEGVRYVFENNGERLQEKVKQQFEQVFARMFARGAFAGSKPEQAYRVVAGSKVNTALSIDAGRFMVELQVAPSHPLKFIRVRLVQEGSGQIQLQELGA